MVREWNIRFFWIFREKVLPLHVVSVFLNKQKDYEFEREGACHHEIKGNRE